MKYLHILSCIIFTSTAIFAAQGEVPYQQHEPTHHNYPAHHTAPHMSHQASTLQRENIKSHWTNSLSRPAVYTQEHLRVL